MQDKKNNLALMSLTALGIVFGDIGTSPLYTIKACFSGFHAIPATEMNVMGVLSLVFWSLLLVISLKYVIFVMRADNHGEGGIFSLFSLLPEARKPGKALGFLALSALFGAALLYGDGFITPSISVLSAMEGLTEATPTLKPVIVPATCGILIGLFLIQQGGTERIGRLFGPVMTVWFAAIAWFGVVAIARNPSIFLAFNPYYAVEFFLQNGAHGILVLGAVVLCITGGEALYADMGHFGRKPITLPWFGVVLPCLVINYFGQGANILANHQAISNPFFALIPKSLIYPMVALASMAAIIASQAIISGVFSLTRQAIQFGYCPRLHIIHTSEDTEGQIYIPEINWLMMIVCVALVLVFEKSDNLAGAYGIAITATMGITSALFYLVMRRVWKWNLFLCLGITGFFLVMDLSFFGANMLKLFGGGWFPLAVAATIMGFMALWKWGRAMIRNQLAPDSMTIEEFAALVERVKPVRIPGTAAYMTSMAKDTPPLLKHSLDMLGALHEHIVLVTIITEEVPRVESEHKIIFSILGNGMYRLIGRYGYMESPHIDVLSTSVYHMGLKAAPDKITYFLGRENLLVPRSTLPARWAKNLFIFIHKNAMSPADYFNIPKRRVVEIGRQVELKTN